MPDSFRSYIKFLIAACLVLSFCLVNVEAQTRRKKRRRAAKPVVEKPVITNPPIAPPAATAQTPATGDVKIISTADSTASEPAQTTESKKEKPPAASENGEMQQTITTLTNQVNRLNDKLTQMQEDDRYQMDMERLTRAEQRAEQLRAQLMDIQSKIADFEARIEQLDFAMRPENIDSATAGYGSTHPEQAREARRKQLENEKGRVQAQLRLAETSKTRLETAVANADAEVDLLRAKLQQRREQMDAQPVEAPARPKKP
ncbi:MAG TPA: hypothetical protein VJ875_20175 [Pyrinomonadaceae bacterium]|nr:hypothetical protein [Pyrinomonadaceae bacterium]